MGEWVNGLVGEWVNGWIGKLLQYSTILSSSPTPNIASISGISFIRSFLYRFARQPNTINFFNPLRLWPLETFLRFTSFRISYIDSFFASCMKPHVLMRSISAFSWLSMYDNPLLVSFSVRLSESTRFFGHPRLTRENLFAIGMRLFHRMVDNKIADNSWDETNQKCAKDKRDKQRF